MAVKGTESKQVIFNKLLRTFEGAFMENDKTLRIPMMENGETIEIKVTLTAAKDILGGGGASSFTNWDDQVTAPIPPAPPPKVEKAVTAEELANIAKLTAALGLN